MHIVLFQPEIPPNTGSIARLCGATQSPLHLIAPLGFKVDDKHLKRAGLDYWQYVDVRLHNSWDDFLKEHGGNRLLFFSKKACQSYTKASFHEEDFLVFGPETRGLPQELLDANRGRSYVIPMVCKWVRSLNLANAVSIVLYEGLRQLGRV
ncbi:MAG: tRNA (uridine(34)/cytosine(34)/5-carboxymethylaminomethyluridine(34)-2'-O)-methyltransferase TrmL [Candidatus Binatia bacterium]|nr:tRNA (uridine(34)/cytosine(34)/5-carboxymethylaminomethyluridine(34)-2'-O)-methyltransferase TrmL [Candidatus Binatia bacterium]